MQLHHVRSDHKRRYKKRVGRGGKRGTTSGRGQKGQKSRAGRRIRPAERDLIIRLPKRRGFRNKPVRPKPLVFNLSDLMPKAKIFLSHGSGAVADRNFLVAAGLIPKNYRGDIKILGNGEATGPLIVKGLKVSKSAKMKIERAGGKVAEHESR